MRLDQDFGDWIDCRHTLPREHGMLVVLYDPTATPTVIPASWNDETEAFDCAINVSRVTHWMPLPQAPKSHAWSDGFMAAQRDEAGKYEDFTHNPHEPTSPYTYPDYHCGPPRQESVEWTAGYEYYQFEHQHGIIRIKLTHTIGDHQVVMYM